MGFFGDLGNAALNGLKDWSAEAQEYYQEGMSMSKEELREEYQRAMRGSNNAKRVGYGKAAKERGLR